MCELQGWQSVEFQVRPRAEEGGQVDKGVKTQSIIAVVGQVGHEYTDLEESGETRQIWGIEWKKGKGMERGKYIFIVVCKIVIKSKSHFPSSHVCEKLRQRRKI